MAAASLTPHMEVADIQGLVLYGYGKLRAARYLVLGIKDGTMARRWLGALGTHITTAAMPPDDTALQVAFTADGLLALGLQKEQLAGFYLIDARDLNDAIQVASKIPPAREGSVEVRPIRELTP